MKGRDFDLGRYGTPEAEAAYRRLIARWLDTGELPGTIPTEVAAPPLTVSHLILKYWRYARGYYRKNGAVTSQVCLIRGALRLLREHYGSVLVAEFGPQKLKVLQDALVARGLTRTGVNRRVDALRLMFKWGVQEELVGVEVHARLATLARLKLGRSEAPEPEPVRPVPAAELEQTLPHLGPVVADLVRLQLLSGARPGELCGRANCADCVRRISTRPGPCGNIDRRAINSNIMASRD